MAKSFTQAKALFGKLSLNSTSTNLDLGGELMNIEHRYLLQKYFSNEGSFDDVTVSQQQFYKLPPNYSKLKTVTIKIGNLQWTPKEILTREEWDKLNVFPYYADIPANYFIYGGKIGIWPIPSTAGNTITYNYKFRVPDLSLEDVTAGTVTVTNGTTAVVGTLTGWSPTTNAQNESRWLKISQPKGDDMWYQVASVDSATTLTLYEPYQGINVAGGSYTLGQMPLLIEDFHDMLVWKPLTQYFSSIVDNKVKLAEYKELYDEKLKLLAEYAGQKSIHVNLGRTTSYRNPNLFYQG